MNEEQIKEYEKCRDNPYYFATKYLIINNTPLTSIYTEEAFNSIFKEIQKGSRILPKARRKF